MPFTPAHAAIVLPLLNVNRRFVSATGLVVGSVVPDFEYFVRMRVGSSYSHTMGGLFYFDLPLAILLGILFHTVVKCNLIRNLPAFIQQRFYHVYKCDFVGSIRKNPWALIIGILIGAFSHLFWDSFTHSDGFFVSRLPVYSTVVEYEEVKYPLYYALQHLSTAVGLLVVTLYILLQKPDPDAMITKPRLMYWVITGGCVLVILFLRFGFEIKQATEGDIVVSFIGASCLALLLNGVIRVQPANP